VSAVYKAKSIPIKIKMNPINRKMRSESNLCLKFSVMIGNGIYECISFSISGAGGGI